MGKPADYIIKPLIGRLAPHWHKASGLAITAVVAFTGVYLGLVLFHVGQFDDPKAILVSMLLPLAITLVWLLEHHLPKVPSNKVGIILSISADDDLEAKRIQSDFTKELTKRLKAGRLCQDFVIISLPQYLIEELEKNPAGTLKLIERLRGHFFLKGYSRRRLVDRAEYHLLKIEAMARHATIPLPISQAFAQDMSIQLPADIRVAVDGDAIAFEATATQIGLGARYSIAVAAALSGALTYAEELLLEIERELSAMNPVPATLEPLHREVPNRLRDVYSKIIFVLAEAYHMKRDKSILVTSEPYCQKLLQRAPEFYPAKLHQAIVCFVLRRDVTASRALLDSCRGVKDNAHRYSQAFLLGYEGELREAHEVYRMAFRNPPASNNVPLQSEEFINIVVDEEPEMGHLRFCTGLINYNAKQDFEAARRDFQQFLALPTIDRFSWAKQKAEELLVYCQRYTAA